MIVVEMTADRPEAVYRERDEREARRFAQTLADLHGRSVSVYRVRGKRRTLLHQATKSRLLGRRH